ncbi:MAG: hypothetical protein ACM3UN_03990 [Bacillota bacterium]
MSKRYSLAKILLLVFLFLLALSIVLAVASLFPVVTGGVQKGTLIDDSFRLSQNEVYRQGLGALNGRENVTVSVSCSNAFMKNFSIETSNATTYSNLTNLNITYSFTADPHYYEAVFSSNAANAGWVHFQVTLEKPQVIYPFSWLTLPAKIVFLLSEAFIALIILKTGFPKFKEKRDFVPRLTVLSKTFRNRLLALLLLSLVLWLIILATNTNPLATFNSWYTDHVRDDYVSSLFLKDGFSVFSQPLGKLASQDSSHYMFVTWPEVPHLYPLGSIVLFLPFGTLLQNGLDPVLVYKLEIALFLVFAHVCLFFFLKSYLKKNSHLFWKIAGLYIIYVSLVLYAAGGMFDSVAFLFALLAVTMFLSERYDYFILLISVSIFFKYQTGIFLLPLIIVGLLKMIRKNNIGIFMNKSVILGIILLGISGFTAYLSAPYLTQTRQELVMNAVNAFTPHSQIIWSYQAVIVLLTLTVTLVYAIYMFNKNSLLSLSAVFLLLPSFMLPYFQYWYIPYVFVYALIPQHKKEVEVTVLWLIIMFLLLCFSGNPIQFFSSFQIISKI